MRYVCSVTAAVIFVLFGWSASASASTIPFCPAVGVNTGCEVLFTRNADGSFTTGALSGEGPYDGVEDTLYGIVNNGPDPLFSVTLGGITNLYGFDGDGACTFPIGCSGGDSTGYGGFVSATGTPVKSGAGNRVFFSGINAALNSGTVNFTGGIPVGGSAWFSLEETVSLTSIPTIGPVTTVPEPGTLSLVGLSLLGLRFRSRFAGRTSK